MIYKVEINDIECVFDELKDDVTILQACLANGIEIPRFCYHEKLTIAGNCRMCLVYVTNEEKLLASCGVPLNEEFDDENIETEIDEILTAREGVMEFLLINHPLDCPICDQGGECDLQEQTINYGLDTGRFYIKKRAVEVKNFGKLIKGIMTRCIHCTRCVRFLTEIAGVADLGVLGRGYNMEIGTYKESGLIDSEVSGNIIDLCPVGALTSATYAYKGRPWELKSHKTIDIFDNLLVSMNFQVKGGEIFRVLPKINDKINEEWITDKSRFHYESYKVINKLRFNKPVFKVDDNIYIEISWQSAIKLFFQLSLKQGLNLDLICGSKINYLTLNLYKNLMRKLGQTNIYNETTLNIVNSNLDFRENYINGNDLAKIEENDLLFLVGVNLRLESPLLNLKIRQLNFTDDDIDEGRPITILGNKFDWRDESKYLGSKLRTLLNILEGRHTYVSELQKSKNPLVICGMSLSMRLKLSMKDLRSYFKKVVPQLQETNLLYISQGANLINSNELGIGKEQVKLSENNLVYMLDSNEVIFNKKPAYIIYQGILNDRINKMIDLYLPSKYYFEDFLGERMKYLNNLGAVCELEKLQITVNKNIKESELIGYIQLFYLNEQNRAVSAVPNIQFKSYAETAKSKNQIKVNKYLTLNNMIENYYKTDILSRYSKNLMATAKELEGKKGVTKRHWSTK